MASPSEAGKTSESFAKQSTGSDTLISQREAHMKKGDSYSAGGLTTYRSIWRIASGHTAPLTRFSCCPLPDAGWA